MRGGFGAVRALVSNLQPGSPTRERAMRLILGLFAVLVLGCNSNAAGEGPIENDSTGGAGGSADVGPAPLGELSPPSQLAPGQGTLVGVTADGWAVFRDAELLRAVKSGESVQTITEHPGSVLIRGNVVFNWADVDWEAGVGDLSVWTSAGGGHEVGRMPYAEALVGASEDGSTIVYTANAQEGATDLMIASSDLSSNDVLIPSMGLGSEDTCGASLGFVGPRLFVGWCEPGSRAARIERYEAGADGWMPTLIAEDALPAWSADAAGERVFFQSSQYSGYIAENGEARLLDAGVARGTILPDGSGVLYSVGDQLRRSDYPDMNPVPIVATGYKQPVELSPGFDLALYSTTVTYENGTQQDLRIVETDGFNPNPIVLEAEPVATLARSRVTRDGQFVFYLTDVTKTGGTLHVVDRSGDEVLALPNVAEVAVARDGMIVLTTDQSDPEQYPVVADLELLDLAAGEREPRLIEAKVLGSKAFQVDAEGEQVFFTRSGVDREEGAPERDGIMVQPLR
jgi:hypothetical protein